MASASWKVRLVDAFVDAIARRKVAWRYIDAATLHRFPDVRPMAWRTGPSCRIEASAPSNESPARFRAVDEREDSYRVFEWRDTMSAAFDDAESLQ